jgi:hypothetical protein
MAFEPPPGGYAYTLVQEPLGTGWQLTPPSMGRQLCSHEDCKRIAVAYTVSEFWGLERARKIRDVHRCCVDHLSVHKRCVQGGQLYRAVLVPADQVVARIEQKQRGE